MTLRARGRGAVVDVEGPEIVATEAQGVPVQDLSELRFRLASPASFQQDLTDAVLGEPRAILRNGSRSRG